MIVQLREYESGEYGLAEAVGEIKELRRQRRVRDRQIEELVQSSNKLQAQASQLEEENLALRYRNQQNNLAHVLRHNSRILGK